MAAEQMLLLIHGLGATGRVWDGWGKLLDDRRPDRWLAPDLPGHGSAPTQEVYSFASMAEGLAEGLDKDVGYVILGHSLGGVVGLQLAAGRYGVQVDVVFGLGIKVEWSDDELTRARSMADRPVEWFDTRGEAAQRYLKVAGLTGVIGPEDESVDAGLRSEDGRWRLAMDPRTFGVGRPDMRRLIDESRAQVVLARGEHDPMNTDRQLAGLHTNVVTLPRLGHNAHVEDPATVLRLLNARIR
jgi:pimeloyl-ACP methyl ester carboxylesterase